MVRYIEACEDLIGRRSQTRGKNLYRLAVTRMLVGGVISVVVTHGAAQTGLPGRGGLRRLWCATHIEKRKAMQHSLADSPCRV
jgi:hypothetical protein